tara:strand:- start:240 stop:854 length:615 start_codon:yes stop_codon:yes gene_type:complete
MRFYLSSYKLGNKTNELKKLIPKNNKTAYIPNALDYSTDLERRRKGEAFDIKELTKVGLDVELLDLRNYFGKSNELKNKLKSFGVIWVRGGNVFILRQAMKLSGFDKIIKTLLDTDMLYGGYSAGVCILASNLHGIDLMDDLTVRPYGKPLEIIWDGLDILDYLIIPHYTSNHAESEDANKCVAYMKKEGLPFKTLKDGEVIII